MSDTSAYSSNSPNRGKGGESPDQPYAFSSAHTDPIPGRHMPLPMLDPQQQGHPDLIEQTYSQPMYNPFFSYPTEYSTPMGWSLPVTAQNSPPHLSVDDLPQAPHPTAHSYQDFFQHPFGFGQQPTSQVVDSTMQQTSPHHDLLDVYGRGTSFAAAANWTMVPQQSTVPQSHNGDTAFSEPMWGTHLIENRTEAIPTPAEAYTPQYIANVPDPTSQYYLLQSATNGMFVDAPRRKGEEVPTGRGVDPLIIPRAPPTYQVTYQGPHCTHRLHHSQTWNKNKTRASCIHCPAEVSLLWVKGFVELTSTGRTWAASRPRIPQNDLTLVERRVKNLVPLGVHPLDIFPAFDWKKWKDSHSAPNTILDPEPGTLTIRWRSELSDRYPDAAASTASSVRPRHSMVSQPAIRVKSSRPRSRLPKGPVDM